MVLSVSMIAMNKMLLYMKMLRKSVTTKTLIATGLILMVTTKMVMDLGQAWIVMKPIPTSIPTRLIKITTVSIKIAMVQTLQGVAIP